MKRVAKFEKVSYKQFEKDYLDTFGLAGDDTSKRLRQAKELIHRANERHLVTFEALKNSEIDKNLMPKLVLNPEKNNFYDMTIDDFSMENYKPMKPQLTLPLGI